MSGELKNYLKFEKSGNLQPITRQQQLVWIVFCVAVGIVTKKKYDTQKGTVSMNYSSSSDFVSFFFKRFDTRANSPQRTANEPKNT